uniref:MACPF domain-containing protein n=1 Tax=Macrostomum lignano TaxID=282301 RepID=A0A1I8F5B6_9PLAT
IDTSGLLDSDARAAAPEAHLFLHVAVDEPATAVAGLANEASPPRTRKSSNSTNFNVGSSLEPNLKARTSSSGSTAEAAAAATAAIESSPSGPAAAIRDSGRPAFRRHRRRVLKRLCRHCARRLDCARDSTGRWPGCQDGLRPVATFANVKQCVRVMAARASSCAAAASSGASAAAGLSSTATSGPQGCRSRMICRPAAPCLEALVPLPEPLKKSLVRLVTESKKLMQLGPGMHTRLQDCEAACMQFYDDFGTHVAKIADSFAWNVRVASRPGGPACAGGQWARCTMVQAEEAGEAHRPGHDCSVMMELVIFF